MNEEELDDLDTDGEDWTHLLSTSPQERPTMPDLPDYMHAQIADSMLESVPTHIHIVFPRRGPQQLRNIIQLIYTHKGHPKDIQADKLDEYKESVRRFINGLTLSKSENDKIVGNIAVASINKQIDSCTKCQRGGKRKKRRTRRRRRTLKHKRRRRRRQTRKRKRGRRTRRNK